MNTIRLSQGRVAIVDDEDCEWLSQWKWYCLHHKDKHTSYAFRGRKAGTETSMHVEIMKHCGLWVPGCQVDHRNNCGLDNRRGNLRNATVVQNARNRRRQFSNTSGHTGLSWDKRYQMWEAYIHVNNKKKRLGHFPVWQDAVDRRLAAERELFGEFAHNPLDLCPGALSFCPDCSARFVELLPKGPTVDWDALAGGP